MKKFLSNIAFGLLVTTSTMAVSNACETPHVDFVDDVNVYCLSEGLAAFTIDTGDYNKAGFVNANGELVISPIYDVEEGQISIPPRFSEGLAAVHKYNHYGDSNHAKWGFIDKQGNQVIPLIYEYAGNFSYGLAAVMKNNKIGYINKKGELVIPFNFDYAWSDSVRGIPYLPAFNKFGLAPVYNKRLDKFGFIDRTGKLVKSYQYAQTDGTSVWLDDGLYNIDSKGNPTTKIY